MGARKIHVGLVFAVLVSPVAWGAENKTEDPWRTFDLATVEVAGVTVRYEKSLAGDLADLRRMLSDFLKQEAKNFAQVDALRAKPDKIIGQVNTILGFSPTDRQKAEQRNILSNFLRVQLRLANPGHKTTIYLVTQKSIKDYLRRGGSLPGFSYDKAKDEANYNFFVDMHDTGDKGERHIALPIPARETVKHLAGFFTGFGNMQSTVTVGLALHELIEVTMMGYRFKPRDPYFRWFSDGFANAVTILVLKQHLGEKMAAAFAKSYDISKYADLEKQINLLYWMGVGFSIEAPIESEQRLNHARYAYATHEAVRLIDRHGIGCVARILDKACKNEQRNHSRNLISAVKEVTGEDIEKRFLRYQTFGTKAEGIERLAASFNAAIGRKDYAGALPLMLRIHELRWPAEPQFYSNAAYLLFRMGREDAGDSVILQQAKFCERNGIKDAYVIMHALFIDYARKCGNLAKAVPSSEIVLKSKADDVPALTIRMLALGTAGKKAEGLKTARRILELTKDPRNPWRKIAEKILATMPP